MKTTGILRRIDDLGRVVIPKECRKALKIKEGEPLEIYIDHENCMIGFRKIKTEQVNELVDKFMQLTPEEKNLFLAEVTE